MSKKLCLLCGILVGGSGFLAAEPEAEASSQEAAVLPATSEEIMQREIDRRREATFRLQENLSLAEQLYRSGEWNAARARFEMVLLGSSAQGSSAGFHQRAQVGMARCLAAAALAKQDEGNLTEASGLMKQAVEYDPQNPRLARQAAKLQEEAARKADPYPGNDAATSDLIAQTEEIKRLLSLADQLTETGQYLQARARLDDVLRIDPYHRVARKKIEKIEDLRMKAADIRYSASREKALAQVTEAWLPPLPARVDPGKARQTGAAASSSSAELLQSLATIRIPELVFNEKPIRAAVDELQRLSQQYDPQKKGINFVLRLPTAAEGKDPEAANVTLELRDIPLQTALKYVCEGIRGGEKLRMEVQENAVLLLPVMESGGELETRNYNLPPSLLANLAGGGTQKADGEGMGPKKLGELVLKNIGVALLEGSSAVCFRETGKLVVRNTPNELRKIEQRIRDAEGEPPQKQFEVETKFLQFSENDLRNFTFNLQMNGNAALPTPGDPGQAFNPAQATGGTDGLRGTAGLSANGVSAIALQTLLDPTYPQDVSNQVGLNARVFGRGFSAILQLLQNAIGKDLVAAPRVTLADGKPSKILISRQMYYPTSYTQPTVPNNDQGVGAGFILPSNPTGFEARDIGVTLEVKGESTSIPKAVDLEFINLVVEDFEGFVDYGAQIATVSSGEGGALDPTAARTVAPVPQPIGFSPYLVPIFSKRSLQSRVRLLDGETVGMGGLISESVQTVDDKVPMLGDVPLLGRFFRSEASQKIKFNLVIFCTLRVINPDGSLRFPEDETNPAYAQAESEEMMPSVP